MSTWVVRAGPNGASVRDSLKFGCAFIGWGETGKLSQTISKADIESLIKQKNHNRDAGTVTKEANQVYNFINEIQIGDTCIMPVLRRSFAIGKFKGQLSISKQKVFFSSAQKGRKLDFYECSPFRSTQSHSNSFKRPKNSISAKE